MTRFDEDVLEVAMRSTMAWERLNGPEAAKLDMQAVESLMVQAGYGRDEAHEAGLRRGYERMRMGEAP